jgi:hypothetical protein
MEGFFSLYAMDSGEGESRKIVGKECHSVKRRFTPKHKESKTPQGLLRRTCGCVIF